MAEPCTTRDNLMRVSQEAADAYAKAVSELSDKIGVVSAPEYHLLNQAAEIGRKRSQRAHDDLERHITEHGCVDAMRTQAS